VSQATLEKKTSVDAGSDLASLVIAYHRKFHVQNEDPASCFETMCRTAAECVKLDEMFYGTDV
jgi:hypothetical protein